MEFFLAIHYSNFVPQCSIASYFQQEPKNPEVYPSILILNQKYWIFCVFYSILQFLFIQEFHFSFNWVIILFNLQNCLEKFYLERGGLKKKFFFIFLLFKHCN